MGGNQSSSSVLLPAGKNDDDAFCQHCEQLYSDLACCDAGSDLSPTFRDKFVTLFGGPMPEFGKVLFQQLFGGDTPDLDNFHRAMTKLKSKTVSSHVSREHVSRESFEFFFSLFVESCGDLHLALQLLVHTSVASAFLSGLTSVFSVPRDHPFLVAMVSAMMQYVATHTDLSETESVYQWLCVHSPQMLTGLRHWLLAILLPLTGKQSVYHLPIIYSKEDRQLRLYVLMWALSGVLSSVFLGGASPQVALQVTSQDDLPQGGSWSCLYSSRDHGLSMNRFQHHCFDYKQPSIMIIECHVKDSYEAHCFAIAMDSEWRDGTYFFGGAHFTCVQLQPTFSVIKRGEKVLSLNEKQRGFPTGLRVMASQKYDFCLLEVQPSFEEVRLGVGEWMVIEVVEVWGCGGREAEQTQKRIKEWEARQVLRRREINSKTLHSTWEENPDRYLLEMGGVVTSTPKENL